MSESLLTRIAAIMRLYSSIAALTFLFWKFSVHALQYYDLHHDGYQFYVARSISEGLTPHRDFFSQYGFVTGYLDSAWLALFGGRPESLKLLAIALVGGSVLLSMRILLDAKLPMWLSATVPAIWLLLSSAFAREPFLPSVSLWAQFGLLLFMLLLSRDQTFVRLDSLGGSKQSSRWNSSTRFQISKQLVRKLLSVGSLILVLDTRPIVAISLSGLFLILYIALQTVERICPKLEVKSSSKSSSTALVRHIGHRFGLSIGTYFIVVTAVVGPHGISDWLYDRFEYPRRWAPSSRAAQLFDNFLLAGASSATAFMLFAVVVYFGMHAVWPLIRLFRFLPLVATFAAVVLIYVFVRLGRIVSTFQGSRPLIFQIPPRFQSVHLLELLRSQFGILVVLWCAVPLVFVVSLHSEFKFFTGRMAHQSVLFRRHNFENVSTSKPRNESEPFPFLIFLVLSMGTIPAAYPVFDSRHLWYFGLLPLSAIGVVLYRRFGEKLLQRIIVVGIGCLLLVAPQTFNAILDRSGPAFTVVTGAKQLDLQAVGEQAQNLSNLSRADVWSNDGFWFGLTTPFGAKEADSVPWAFRVTPSSTLCDLRIFVRDKGCIDLTQPVFYDGSG